MFCLLCGICVVLCVFIVFVVLFFLSFYCAVWSAVLLWRINLSVNKKLSCCWDSSRYDKISDRSRLANS